MSAFYLALLAIVIIAAFVFFVSYREDHPKKQPHSH